MNIKISTGHAVTEITENNGIWRVKRNGAKLTDEVIEGLIKAVKGDLNERQVP